jgi:hypothetical protein
MAETSTINTGLGKWQEYLPGIQDSLSNFDTKSLQAILTQLQQFTPAMTDVQGQERGRQVANDTRILQDQAPAYAKAFTEAQRLFDPNYSTLADRFTTESGGATDRYKDLLNTYNITGGLSESEKESVSRETNKKNVKSGNLNRDSATRTVGNALNYGDRYDTKRKDYGSLLGNYGNLLTSFGSVAPSLKSGVDVSKLPGLYGSGGNALGTAFGNVSGNRSTSTGLLNSFMGNVIKPQTDQEKVGGWAKIGGEVLGGVAAGVGLMCWVAREVYGSDNPRWMLFRNWLLTEAPVWFRELYEQNGERFAAWISNKPFIKRMVRTWMDWIIKKNFNYAY